MEGEADASEAVCVWEEELASLGTGALSVGLLAETESFFFMPAEMTNLTWLAE